MLRRCLGPVAVTAQAVGTVGLTLTAVFNITEAMRSAGSPNGIAGCVGAGLGPRTGALARWALLLGYGATLLGCLVFFGLFLEQLALHLGLQVPRLVAYLLGVAAWPVIGVSDRGCDQASGYLCSIDVEQQFISTCTRSPAKS